MPFGRKKDTAGAVLDFDVIYRELIEPAIREADLEPHRADEEMNDGIIQKAMFERLILSRYAVADLTTANPNVFYELGIRHAVRPWSTVLIFAEGARLPFDAAPLRALPYPLTASGMPAELERAKAALVQRLLEARDPKPDSPVFQLVEGRPFTEPDHSKTDTFRDRVRYSNQVKELLAVARKRRPNAVASDALRAIERDMGNIVDADSAAVVDLFLSFRDVGAWDDMIRLTEAMSRPLSETVMVREQLAFALNRAGHSDRAERVLLDLLRSRGASSETAGLLGRVYKDRWEAATKSGQHLLARGLLDKAIDAYLRGFEADWRDAYPGVNVVTLMELREPPDARRIELIPVVSYAVQRRIGSGRADYWDHATLLELAVLGNNVERALAALADALVLVRAAWEPETTARNLRLIREARERRGSALAWTGDVEETLLKRAARV
jgi:tetratricopeptide (TPR) repeat protein